MKIITAIVFLAAFTATAQQQNNYFLARSVGKLSMFSAGLGEDRLGGAKLGYIDTAVLLKVVDSVKELYKVQLSTFHTAYISKADVVEDTSTLEKPFYLTKSFSIKGDATYDYVNIGLDEKLAYKSWMEIDPAKISVDVYGVQSNTNWITQLKSAKEVKAVYFNQVEDDVVRVTIELIHPHHWGYTINYKSNVLSVRIRRPPSEIKINQLLIAVDAGHGGTNTGAIGIKSKGEEKNYTLRFANELEKYLTRKGSTVIMTRNNDTTYNNVDRVLMLQQVMPHLLISLHLNSSANNTVQGVSTYYKHIGFKSITTALLDRLLQLNLSEFGNVGNFNFTLNAPTDFPNSLVEIAFLSNVEDEKKIMDAKFQKAVAKKIYKGIKDWLKLVRR